MRTLAWGPHPPAFISPHSFFHVRTDESWWVLGGRSYSGTYTGGERTGGVGMAPAAHAGQVHTVRRAHAEHVDTVHRSTGRRWWMPARM